jgi:hypothetical protein
VGASFNRREFAERLCAAFKKSTVSVPPGMEVTIHNNGVYLSRELNLDDMASLCERLDEVMAKWVRMWKEFGGLKKLVQE